MCPLRAGGKSAITHSNHEFLNQASQMKHNLNKRNEPFQRSTKHSLFSSQTDESLKEKQAHKWPHRLVITEPHKLQTESRTSCFGTKVKLSIHFILFYQPQCDTIDC